MDWLMQRLGASVEELANEAYEELMGFQGTGDETIDALEGKGGHKPPRNDIAKLKQIADLHEKATATRWMSETHPNPEAADQWDSMTEMTPDEAAIIRSYGPGPIGGTSDFDHLVRRFTEVYPTGIGNPVDSGEPVDWKSILASAIKKQQIAKAPQVYDQIDGVLRGLKAHAPESYKLWPWVVKQIKNSGDRWDYGGGSHIIDVVSEAGKIIDEERRQNRLPRGFDINQMDFQELEDWVMCLDPATPILLASGEYKAAGEITARDILVGWDAEKGSLVEAYTPSGAFDAGIQMVYEIQTHRGRVLRVTGRHPVLTDMGWKLTEDLEPGDRVRVALGWSPPPSQSFLEEDIAWLLGFLVGDGRTNSKGEGLTNSDDAILDHVRIIIGRKYGCELVPRGDHPSQFYFRRIGALPNVGSTIPNPMREMLKEFGLKGQNTFSKRIPLAIWQGGPKAWASFLSGLLDADGSVGVYGQKRKRAQLKWYGSNYDLLQECQQMLAMLDIQSALSLAREGGIRDIMGAKRNARPSFQLQVLDAASFDSACALLTPVHSMKRNGLKAVNERRQHWRVSDNRMWDRVTYVTEIELMPTVGIPVELFHTHITSGLVTHNSWKRDNRESESKGEVVYEWPDGWTMQRLTSPASLQYEGDEMSHCVGGYTRQVDSGESIIYSLRDPKGGPHVTMELEGPELMRKGSDKPLTEFSAEDVEDMRTDSMAARPHATTATPLFEDADDYKAYQDYNGMGKNNMWPPYFVHKERHSPHSIDENQQYYNRKGIPWDKSFFVVQVQGQGNQTPKPEYQARMKEFLDYLRSKGFNFERSENWYAPYDEGDDREIWDSSQLGEFYEDFHQQPEKWTGEQKDAYGMPHQNTLIGPDTDIVDMMVQEFLQGTNGDDAMDTARQVYYYSSLQGILGEWLLGSIERAYQRLDEQGDNAWEQATGGWWPNQNDYEDEEEYYKAEQASREEYLGTGFKEAFEFLSYLQHLVAKHGVAPPEQLPHKGNGMRVPVAHELESELKDYWTDPSRLQESSPYPQDWAVQSGKEFVPFGQIYDGAPQQPPPQQTPGTSNIDTTGVFSKVGSPQCPNCGNGQLLPVGVFKKKLHCKTCGYEAPSDYLKEFPEEWTSKTSANDPNYLFVYYMSELRVQPWEHNLSYEQIFEDLLNEFNVDLGNTLMDIDAADVDAGEIRIRNGKPELEHKQLCPPEIREQAEEAINQWWADQWFESIKEDWYEPDDRWTLGT